MKALKLLALIMMSPVMLLAQYGNISNPITTTSAPVFFSPSAGSFSSDTYTQSVFSAGNSYDILGCLNTNDNVCLRAIMQSSSASVLTTAVSGYNAYNGTGTNALVIGMEGFPQQLSSGTVTDMPALAGQCGNAANATGTITRCEGLYIFPATNNSGAGVIQTAIGVYVLPQTLGTVANYAILTTGGTNDLGDTTNIRQQTAATNTVNQNSPNFNIIGNYWTGAASAADIYTWQDVALAGGANPAEILNLSHTGSSGALFMQLPGGMVVQPATNNTGSIGASGNTWANYYGGNYRLSGNVQNLAGTTTMGMTLKKGTGSGNYTTASTTFAVVDSTNLCFTVTIPTGWKLGVQASVALATATAAVTANVALTDNAACSTANAGILQDSGPIGPATAAASFESVNLSWVITGDGSSHNVALQYKTSNAADSATIGNSSATILPTMVFTLMPSN